MQFKETIYIGNKKEERILEFADSKAAEKYADDVFDKNKDAMNMNCNWSGPEVSIYFRDCTMLGKRKSAAKIIYKLEPVGQKLANQNSSI